MHILKCIISDDNLLESIFIEIHCVVDVREDWRQGICIVNHIVQYRGLREGRRGAFQREMLEVDRNLSVDPAHINELVIAHGEIAVVLRVDQGGIASLINASEGIIIPYLIIGDAALSVNLALRHRLVDGNSVYFCNSD